MTTNTILCIMLVLIGILFVRQLREDKIQRSFDKISDAEKADQIIDYLNAQERLIKEMNGRIDCLGDVVEILVRMQDRDEFKKRVTK